MWERIRRSNFIIKLTHWEYWPFGIVQFPVILYYLWLSLRARSFLFFSASNPGIAMGGMFGESKYDVLKKIPSAVVPKTILVKRPVTTPEVMALLQHHTLSLPVIFKPELGERGFMVKRIHTTSDVSAYLASFQFNFLIQELVDLPLEFGIFYTRFPQQTHGQVTSVVMKELLTITGDGTSTLQQLILAKDRAKLQWPTLQQTFHDELATIIPSGEVKELVSIGNHCLGTKFIDGTHLINDKLSSTFDSIAKQIDGFYFGRFDLRCATLDDLYEGNVQIMELNGCGAEPAHIYQPGYSLRKAVGVLLLHWRNIFIISSENVKRGHALITVQQAKEYYRNFKLMVR